MTIAKIMLTMLLTGALCAVSTLESFADDQPTSATVGATATAGAETAAAAAPSKDAKHDSGVPGLKPRVDLATWSLLTFGIFVFLLQKFAWGPLSAALDAREQKIRKDLDDAEAARLKAERMLAEYDAKMQKTQDEVRELLAEARRDAEHAKSNILATAQQEASAERKRAVADIGRAKDEALGEIFAAVSSQVVAATEKVVGRTLQGDDHERLVREALAQFHVSQN